MAFLEGLRELRGVLDQNLRLPLFGELEASVQLSEPDEDLPVPWERFSPAEELHEEIYFGAIAALETLTHSRGSGSIRAPGSIVPRVTVREGSPTQIRLRVTAAGEVLQPAQPLPLKLREIGSRSGQLHAVPVADPPPGYGIPAGQLPPGLEIASLPRAAAREDASASGGPRASYLPEQAWALASAAAKRAGGLAWIEGISYLGREIPVIAWAKELREMVTSPRRIAQHRPTLLVVAGHHANETSSTVSSLQFAAGLKEMAAEAFVLVVPMENPDGAALHRELQELHPRWKLHAARFNAVGHEFGRDGDDSPFGESLVRPRLMRDFLVDVLVDDHGVPGHEWAQPFSGRSSPPLFPIAYTYPSGIFYGIGPGASGDEPGEDILPFWQRATARLDRDPELREAQALLWDRYERYGQKLCPERYPSRRSGGWPFQSTRRATHREASSWPLEFVTEVADEGASPKQFDLCVRAHLQADVAVLEVLQALQRKPDRLPKEGREHQ